jgi:hypothetical protein
VRLQKDDAGRDLIGLARPIRRTGKVDQPGHNKRPAKRSLNHLKSFVFSPRVGRCNLKMGSCAEAAVKQQDWSRIEKELGEMMPGVAAPPDHAQGIFPDKLSRSNKDATEAALAQIAKALESDMIAPAVD